MGRRGTAARGACGGGTSGPPSPPLDLTFPLLSQPSPLPCSIGPAAPAFLTKESLAVIVEKFNLQVGGVHGGGRGRAPGGALGACRRQGGVQGGPAACLVACLLVLLLLAFVVCTLLLPPVAACGGYRGSHTRTQRALSPPAPLPTGGGCQAPREGHGDDDAEPVKGSKTQTQARTRVMPLRPCGAAGERRSGADAPQCSLPHLPSP